MFNEINEKMHDLLKIDKEISQNLNAYQDASSETETLQEKMSIASATVGVSNADLMKEIDTVRQMAKMTVGRKGNHFPNAVAALVGGRARVTFHADAAGKIRY